jgi:hypothetical protein
MQSIKKPKRELGIKFFAGAVAVTAAIAFSSAWKGRREPATEPILDCWDKVTCPSNPVKGDNKCELRHGENDPLSKNFDPQSCGYCGDGVRQVTAKTGAAPYMDADSLIWMQNVTERPTETPESCPVEFHCGNNRLDIGATYGAVVEDDGAFSIGTITINESCRTESKNLCVPDCRERRHARMVEQPDEPPVPTWGSVLTCPSEIATESTRDIVSARSLGAGSVLGRIAGTIREHSVALRTTLAVDPADELKVLVSMRVSPSGVLTLTGVSTTCNNSPCGSHAVAMSALGLSLGGLSVGGPGRECYWTVAMRVP